jgi:hypothetical protein
MLAEVIREDLNSCAEAERLGNFSLRDANTLAKKHARAIGSAIDNVLEKLPLSRAAREQLVLIARSLFWKQMFGPASSGVVITGFGERNLFPELFELGVEGTAGGKLRYEMRQREQISADTASMIRPFAQTDMVDLFAFGVHSNYQDYVEGFLEHALEWYGAKALEILGRKNPDAAKRRLAAAAEKVMTSFAETTHQHRRSTYYEPILQAISSLPKRDLAMLAQSLVHLTALRRKVSMGAETVGGPIGIAVISRSEGFSWIRRVDDSSQMDGAR